MCCMFFSLYVFKTTQFLTFSGLQYNRNILSFITLVIYRPISVGTIPWPCCDGCHLAVVDVDVDVRHGHGVDDDLARKHVNWPNLSERHHRHVCITCDRPGDRLGIDNQAMQKINKND